MLGKQTTASAIGLSMIAEQIWYSKLRKEIAQVDTEGYSLISIDGISLNSLYKNLAKPFRRCHCCHAFYTFNL